MARKKINWPRYALQWGVLAAIILFLTGIIKGAQAADPETYCPMGGLQAFVTYLVRGSLPCSMSSVQIMMGLCLAAAVILFSKLFCSYVCPVGTVEDLLFKLRRGIGLRNVSIKNGSKADKILRIFKYGLLFWIFYSTATASELFCKNLDPYYAVATGFKGEITLWMSIVSLVLVVLGGILVDNFWCKYICPLGAVSASLKFYIPLGILAALWWVLVSLCGLEIPWWVLLALFCLFGYLFEIFFSERTAFQLLYVLRDPTSCNGCKMCEKKCPYHIALNNFDGRVNSVDCSLCGECVAACAPGALSIGVVRKGNGFTKFLPAILALALGVGAYFVGRNYELPTIDETWGIYSADSLKTQLVDPSTLETVKLEGLKQVHCYGSSRAFMGKLQKIKGVYGVKTYVKSHSAVVTYDPAKTSPEKISEQIYVPSHFKCLTPDYKAVPEVKVITIRTENMPASSDLNFLGIQFKQVDSLVYGLDSQWDCPLIVRMYVDPAFDKDDKWIESIVEKPSLDITRADGTVKSTPTAFRFVRREKGFETIPTTEFLQRMFTNPFKAEFKSRVEAAAGKPQLICEWADEMFTKPLITRGLPFVSNHLSREDGIIGVYTCLNEDYVPCLRVRYAAPMTEEKIWEMLSMPEWTITYSPEDVRQVPAKIKFKKRGKVSPYVPWE